MTSGQGYVYLLKMTVILYVLCIHLLLLSTNGARDLSMNVVSSLFEIMQKSSLSKNLLHGQLCLVRRTGVYDDKTC